MNKNRDQILQGVIANRSRSTISHNILTTGERWWDNRLWYTLVYPHLYICLKLMRNSKVKNFSSYILKFFDFFSFWNFKNCDLFILATIDDFASISSIKWTSFYFFSPFEKSLRVKTNQISVYQKQVKKVLIITKTLRVK